MFSKFSDEVRLEGDTESAVALTVSRIDCTTEFISAPTERVLHVKQTFDPCGIRPPALHNSQRHSEVPLALRGDRHCVS